MEKAAIRTKQRSLCLG